MICHGSGRLVRGIRPVERTLEKCTADAALIKANIGTTLFLMSDIVSDQNGRLMCYTREHIIGDSVKLRYRPDAAFTIDRTDSARVF